jgi:hypothetical protein
VPNACSAEPPAGYVSAMSDDSPTTDTPTTATPTTSDPTAGAEKDPGSWVTGDEPMTGPQASYLATLAHDTGREVPETLTKAEASTLIDELRRESDRVR